MNQDKWNQDSFVDHLLSTPIATVFRTVQGTWWVFSDDYWTIDWSGNRINRAILAEMEQVGWDKGQRGYIVDKVRRQLKAELNTDRLPGRYRD